jgi:IS30 family transposase
LQLKEIEEAKEAKKVNLENVKNEVLKKFGDKILELKEEGLSVRKIAEYINKQSKSKRKISYGTIYNFLKQQKKNNG